MTKRLTKAEEEIMLVLWRLEEATIREIMEDLNEPETPYTTISTVVRILEKKGIIGHRAVGSTYLYQPLLEKKEYLKGFLSGIVTKYFDGSYSRLTSFFASENDMSLEELQEIIKSIKTELKEDQNHE